MPYFSKVQQGLCRGVLLPSAINQSPRNLRQINEKTISIRVSGFIDLKIILSNPSEIDFYNILLSWSYMK